MVGARVRRFYATFEHLLHEIAKFGVVGAVAFVLTTVLNNLFHFGLDLGPLTSFGLATIIAATLSYFANRHWTWKHKDDNGLGRGLTMFLLLSAVGLAISEIPVGFSEYVLGLHSKLAYNISSTFVGTALGTVWRFWSFRRWVFVSDRSDAVAPSGKAAVLAPVGREPYDELLP
ncbi:MAG TPA: GtrA family protein [Mycobacteriales bacterium]|nr:GtrA family protein [Mycobacteriales bacterium]